MDTRKLPLPLLVALGLVQSTAGGCRNTCGPCLEVVPAEDGAQPCLSPPYEPMTGPCLSEPDPTRPDEDPKEPAEMPPCLSPPAEPEVHPCLSKPRPDPPGEDAASPKGAAEGGMARREVLERVLPRLPRDVAQTLHERG